MEHGILNAAKAQVTRSCADLALAPSADQIPGAILIRAKERATAHGSLWLTRLRRIERGFRSLGVTRRASRGRELAIIVRTIPVADPLPHIAGHVIQSIAVWRERIHGTHPGVAIRAHIP